MNKKIDLGWGNSIAVRQAFLENSSWSNTHFTHQDLISMNYPPHEGDSHVINLTKWIIKRQTGLEYKHILLTNGATGGVTIALRAFAKKGYNTCFTMSPPYFPLYPSMISAAGLKHKTEGALMEESDVSVALIDSPSNPLGLTPYLTSESFNMPIIWDAVYANNVYTPIMVPPVHHDVVVGSYSKLTGFNGLRLGWVATNDDLLYHRMEQLVTAEYAGLSVPDTKLLLALNDGVFWEQFEVGARAWLNYNREEWSKLERYFGGTPVNPIGMFFYSYMDESCRKLLEKAEILYMMGSRCGTTDEYGRFNLGADPKTIKEAVRAVLKADKIHK